MPDQRLVAGDEAGAQTRPVRPLRQAVEDQQVAEALAQRLRRFEGTGRRVAIIDLGIAFVDDQHEIVLPGQADRLLQIIEVGNGALRIRRRAEKGQRRPVEEVGVERGEIGQEPGRARRRQRHHLGAGHDRRPAIGLVERVGDERRRPLSGLLRRHGQLRSQIQAFLGAGQRQQMAEWIEEAGFEIIAPGQPVAGGRAKLVRAHDRRVAVPLIGMGCHDLCDPGWRRMLRLADTQDQRPFIAARHDIGQEHVQPRKRIIA